MTGPDYYEILGVSRRAKPREIEQAYLKLARKYHPDVNPGDQQAREKFEQVQEAFNVLSDPKKRVAYDRQGVYPESVETKEESLRRAVEVFFEGFDEALGERTFDEVIREVLDLGGTEAAREPQPERGTDIEVPLAVDFQQALTGFTSSITVTRKITCPTCAGAGVSTDLPVTCPDCEGRGRRPISRGRLRLSSVCRRCGGKGKARPVCPACGGTPSGARVPVTETISVEIPPGVAKGSRIRIAAKGDAGPHGGAPGDLYIVTNVDEHPFFTRKGDNIYCIIPITIAEAVLGTKIEVPTISGKATLRIPPGAQAGQVFRLRGKGVRSLRGNARGDQYVEIQVVIPSLVDERSKDLLRQFEQLNPQAPRRDLESLQPLIPERENE
jgi:molecular chaperone DnaJ